MNGNRIRVLRAITWLPVGGIERKIVEVLPRLDPARFDVSLVCLRERGPLADDLEAAGVRVDCIPFGSRWDPAAMARLASLMRREKVDLVHSHMYRANLPATTAARIAGVPRVWGQVHNVGTWETPRQRAMDRFLCRWRTGMVAVSERVRADVIEQLGLPEDRVRLIYNGVNLERFGRALPGRAERRAALRSEAGVGDGDIVFLLLARMVSQKRPGDFLDLARYLLGREAAGDSAPRAHFWFVGEGGLLEDLQREAAAIDPAGRIRFYGRRDDVPDFMAAADVFVMTSSKEGFSNALLEAMASGLAVIATNVGGNAEAVRDGVDGFIIQPGEPTELREAAEALLASPYLLEARSTAAAERAHAFSLGAMVKNVEALYAEGTE